jgi:hypothetical protein
MDNSDPADATGTITASGDAPAVTEGRRSRKGCLVWCGLIGVCLVVLFSVAPPQIMRMRIKGDQVVAMNNGKSLALALNDFAAEYGRFPDQETAKVVNVQTKTDLKLDGDFSNDYFRQLIAAGVVKSEDPFFAKTPYSRYAPNNILKGAFVLQAGEVGFGYLMNGDKAMPAEDPNRIIAVTPLLNATATGEFDPKPLAGKAVLVFLDGSVKRVSIRDADHRVELNLGRTLLEHGAGTLWAADIHPVIKPPQTPRNWVPTIIRSKPPGLGWWLAGAVTFALIAWWVMVKRRGTATA